VDAFVKFKAQAEIQGLDSGCIYRNICLLLQLFLL
jgi:hypothetical protein